MTTPSDNSQTEPQTTTKTEADEFQKIAGLSEALSASGVRADSLVICSLGGGEQIIGELFSVGPMSAYVRVKNPRRFIRLQKTTPQGLQIDFMIVDLDLLNEAVITVNPVMFFELKECDSVTKERYFGAYLQYLESSRQTAPTQPPEAPRPTGGLVLPPAGFRVPGIQR